MLSLMVHNGTGWKKVGSFSGKSPSCIGVQIGKGNGNVVPLEVGDDVVLESKKVKTFVNKGLCSLGFESHYYPNEHMSTLTSGELGVAFKLHHADNRYPGTESRMRSGGVLERIK